MPAADSKTVDLIFSFRVKDQERYEQAVAQQLAITQDEPHVLGYDVFRREDGTYCQHERYADEAAIRLHMKNTEKPLAVWTEVTEIISMTALGPLSEEYKKEFGMENYLPYKSVKR